MFVAFLQHSLNSNALTWIKLKWREEKKIAKHQNTKRKSYWPNLNSSDSVKNYFVHIAIGVQSIVPKTHHSAHCLGMQSCTIKKTNPHDWLVFPTYQLHITSLLFITASWKIMPHTIPSRETETQLNKEFNVFFVVVVVAIAIAIAIACCRKRHNTNF